MDSTMNPAYYRDASPEQAITDTEATIAHINQIDPTHSLITPIITPRFAPSCTSPLLSSLGALSAKESLPVQTHISENTSEIALVATLFPAQSSYADVYDAHGLLTPRTVLAHGVHLSHDERALIKKRESKISHCPVSNTSISSGLCPVRELLDEGIEVGLGTDVSGGYSPSVLVAAREAAMVSRVIASLTPEDDQDDGHDHDDGTVRGKAEGKDEGEVRTSAKDRKKLSVEETLYLATRGGANCLNLGHRVGAFEVGMLWDAQLVALDSMAEEQKEGEVQESEEDDDPAVHLAELARFSSSEKEVVEGEELGRVGRVDRGIPTLWGNETWEEKIAKWVLGGDDRNTKMVFVGGRRVHSRS